MANVTVTIPDALVPRLRSAMRATFPQHEALSDAAAFKAVTADYWRTVLADYEGRQAEAAAWAAQRAAVDAAKATAAADGAGIG